MKKARCLVEEFFCLIFGNLNLDRMQEQTSDVVSNTQAHVYPNPFNSSSIVSFDSHNETNVQKAVYDAVGKKIQVLFNESLSAVTRRVMNDRNNLTSGIYFVRLTMKDGITILKVKLPSA